MSRVLAPIIFLLSMPISNLAYACSGPKPGYDWHNDQLIDMSDVIVVAELVDIVDDKFYRRYQLKPVETLKGAPPEIIEFYSHGKVYQDNTFTNHTDDEFWMDGVGRSPWPCCICGPDHTFIKGQKYLLFPIAFGAMKSAEMVSDPNDEWYKYVSERVR